MRVSNLTPEYVRMWLGYSDEAEDDVRNTRDIMLALTAAISAAASYSGLTVAQMDEYEDITVAVLGICNDYLTNNRPEQAERKMNAMSADILGRHSRNLL